jgi:hypothetical protein
MNGLDARKRSFSGTPSGLVGGSNESGGVVGGDFVSGSQLSRGSRSSELAKAVAGRLSLAWGGGGRQAMLSEIRLISKLRHPNITTVSSPVPKSFITTPLLTMGNSTQSLAHYSMFIAFPPI